MSWRIITRPAAGHCGKCRAEHRALAESGSGVLKMPSEALQTASSVAGCGKVLLEQDMGWCGGISVKIRFFYFFRPLCSWPISNSPASDLLPTRPRFMFRAACRVVIGPERLRQVGCDWRGCAVVLGEVSAKQLRGEYARTWFLTVRRSRADPARRASGWSWCLTDSDHSLQGAWGRYAEVSISGGWRVGANRLISSISPCAAAALLICFGFQACGRGCVRLSSRYRFVGWFARPSMRLYRGRRQLCAYDRRRGGCVRL